MEIGGQDYIFHWDRPREELLGLVFAQVGNFWPSVVAHRDPEAFEDLDDVWYLYQDEDAVDAWERDGGTEENCQTMIQLFISTKHEEGTLVGDNEPLLTTLVQYIRNHHVPEEIADEDRSAES